MTIPLIREFDFTYGRPDRLSPLIRRVICENPGPFTYTGSGTYIIGAGDGVALIDPGPADLAHTEAIMRALGDAALTHILVTHTHSDHCGGTGDLVARCNAPVYGFGPHPVPADKAAPALDEGADFGFRPDHLLKNGDRLSGPGWTLEALHTPGHISNHLCFALQEEKALFTGDHIMGWATTVVVVPEGDMGDYFASLDLLLGRDDRIYYPTHGAPIPEPKAFVQAVKHHRERRDAQIMDALGNGIEAVPEMVRLLYKGVDRRLHGAAAMNVEAHLNRLVTLGKVVRTGNSFAPTSSRG